MIALLLKHYRQHKEIADNFAWRVMQIAGQQGIILLAFIICAKLLTPYDFGIYNYALSVIFFLAMFGDFGISTATSKYVVEYNLVDKDKLRGVLFNSAVMILGVTVLMAILSILFGGFFLKEKSVYIYYLIPLLFLSPMTALYDGIYRGLKKFKYLAIVSSVVGALSALLIYFIVRSYGLTGALLFQDAFYLVLFAALALGYKDFTFKFSKSVIKEISSYSLMYGLAIAGNYLFIRFGILILGHYGYIKEIATYELLNKIFLITVIPFTMLGQVVAPNFTEMRVRGEYEKIYSKLKSYSIIFFLVGLGLSTIFYLLTPLTIKAFFPQYYNNLFFQILPFSIIIYATNIWAATIDAGILIPTGFAGLMAKFYVVLGIIGCLLGFFLTKYIGYMGVIYSFAISNIIMILGLRFLFFKKIYHLKNNRILR